MPCAHCQKWTCKHRWHSEILPRGPPPGKQHLYIRDESGHTTNLYWHRVCVPTCKVNALLLGLRETRAELRRLHLKMAILQNAAEDELDAGWAVIHG